MPDKSELANVLQKDPHSRVNDFLDRCVNLSQNNIPIEEIPWFDAQELRDSKDEVSFNQLHDVMCGRYVADALEALAQSGILQFLIPALVDSFSFDNMKNIGAKKIWPHTKVVVAQSEPTLMVRWAALFHDLGKPKTFNDDEKVSFHRHELVSARIFARFARTWKLFSKSKAKKIERIIENLGYVEAYTDDWTDRAVRRFIRDVGDDVLDPLFKLSEADITTKHDDKRRRIISRIEKFKLRIDNVQKEDNQGKLLPKGIGLYIIRELNIEPGKQVKEIKDRLENDVRSGLLEPMKSSEYYISYLKTGIPVEDSEERVMGSS